jgi:hypothetical protein
MQGLHNVLPPQLPQAFMLSLPNSSLAPLQIYGCFVHMNVGCDNHVISLAAKNDVRMPNPRECFRGTFHHHNPRNSFCGFKRIIYKEIRWK